MADRREGSLEIIADWDTSANSAMAAALSAGGGARLKEPPARVAQKVFPRGHAPKDEIAKGAITRKLAVRLQWMWRQVGTVVSLKSFVRAQTAQKSPWSAV